jgi:osmotically-inducible protein OsmY
MFSRRQKTGKRRSIPMLLTGAAGAAAAYLFDPDRGRTRRAKLADQIGALSRKAEGKLGRRTEYAAGVAEGWRHKFSGHGEEAPPSDPALADKVKSQIFSGLDDVDSGAVNIDAHDGVVVLRGQLAERSHIDDLASRTTRVVGVRDVVNLLHLPGEEPPNVAAAHEASDSARR